MNSTPNEFKTDRASLIESLKIKIADFKGLLAMRDENLLRSFIETDIEKLIDQLK